MPILDHTPGYPAACVVDGAGALAVVFTTGAFLVAAAFFVAFLAFVRVGADFFATGDCNFAASAFFVAQRFFKAATIAAFPALLSLRFGLDGSGVAGGSLGWAGAANWLAWASTSK